VEITQQDMIAIELRTDEECKSPFQAYVLWFFLGWLGAHRFYVGHGKSGLAMLILTLSMVGFPISLFWWLADSVRGNYTSGDATFDRSTASPTPLRAKKRYLTIRAVN